MPDDDGFRTWIGTRILRPDYVFSHEFPADIRRHNVTSSVKDSAVPSSHAETTHRTVLLANIACSCLTQDSHKWWDRRIGKCSTALSRALVTVLCGPASGVVLARLVRRC